MILPKVYVYGGPHHSYEKMTENTFLKVGKYAVVSSLWNADIVVFTGGEDIHPGLYGEKAIDGVYCAPDRDLSDVEMIERAYDKKLFMVGICRGAQLLNCLPNGGSLWQDVDGHGGGHHKAFDCITGKNVNINTVHHQMMKLTDKGKLLCWAMESTERHSEKGVINGPFISSGGITLEKDKDVEAAYYEDTNSFLFQAHPEFGHKETTDYFFSLMNTVYFGK